MNFHEIANVFPLLHGPELAKLVEDIRAHGLLEPITQYEDKILDGRNRWRACNEAGVEPLFNTYEGDDPIGFVVSKNVNRRHMTLAQLGFVGVELANMKQGGTGANQYVKAAEPPVGGSANLKPLKPEAEVAEDLGISTRTIQRARVLKKHGDVGLIEKVKAGDTSLRKEADKITKARRRTKNGESQEEEEVFPYQEPCTDCNTAQEQWQRSLSNMLGDILSFRSYWDHLFGTEWRQYPIPSSHLKLAAEAEKEFVALVAGLKEHPHDEEN